MLRIRKEIRIGSGVRTGRKIYSVTVYNAITSSDCFAKIAQVIKTLTHGDEMFFGFYRTDGLTLNEREWQKCVSEIPEFFKKNGEYREIIEEVTNRKGKTKIYEGMLTVARAGAGEELFEQLQWILQYYLESTFFVPNIGFDEFEAAYRNYMKQPTVEYLMRGYTDFLFSYFDSGDFSVSFDAEKHSAEQVAETVKRIFMSGK